MNPNDLIPGMLPRNEISIIAGASGAGKTSLIFGLLSAIQHQERFLGTFPAPAQPPRIGYIAADRGGDSLVMWAEKYHVDMNQIAFRSLVTDTSINVDQLEERSFQILQDLIKSLQPLDLLIVDPMIVFLGGDTKSYMHNAARLIKLNRLAHRLHLTILGTHHAAKARTDYGYKRPQDRISGTGAFLGYTSTQMFLDTPEESGKDNHTFHVISHTAPGMEIMLGRDQEGKFFPVIPEGIPAIPIPDQILSIFTQGEVPRATVTTLLCPTIPTRTVDFHLKRLLDSGQIVKSSFGKYKKS